MKQAEKHSNTTESKVITFIGGFYIFGSFVVLLSLIFGGSPLNSIFGLPHIPDNLVKIGVILYFAPAGYLYIQRSVIGYWMIMLSAIAFICISATLVTRTGMQPYVGNLIYSLFVAIATYVWRGEFGFSRPAAK